MTTASQVSPNEVLDQTGPQLHVRFQGRSIDVPLSSLDLGSLSTDAEVRSAVAEHLGVPPVKLEAFRVDRTPGSGELTLRPEAEFGTV